jgi:hypothetical protein
MRAFGEVDLVDAWLNDTPVDLRTDFLNHVFHGGRDEGDCGAGMKVVDCSLEIKRVPVTKRGTADPYFGRIFVVLEVVERPFTGAEAQDNGWSVFTQGISNLLGAAADNQDRFKRYGHDIFPFFVGKPGTKVFI